MPTPIPIRTASGSFASKVCAGGAISVLHLRVELEVKELLVRSGVHRSGPRQELYVRKEITELQTALELAHIVAISSETTHSHEAIPLDVRGQPEPPWIPVRIVDLRGIVAFQ